MRKLLLAALTAATLPVHAEVFTDVTFDCAGALSSVLETPEGARATGLVNITTDLPDGSEWDSAGVIVISLPPEAAGRDVDGVAIRRCRGRGTLETMATGSLKGVGIVDFRLAPTDVSIRVGNQRISDPTRVAFGSSAGGSPNI